MRPVFYSINVTLDGCCDHRVFEPDAELHRHTTALLQRADALLLGRVTYLMMEEAFRPGPDAPALPDWMQPFAGAMHAARKHVFSHTLAKADWNAELVRGDVGDAVRRLKQQPGKGLLVGGMKLPLALAEQGLIDEYEFVVHPFLAGHGPMLLAGLSRLTRLRLVGRTEFACGAVAMRYVPEA